MKEGNNFKSDSSDSPRAAVRIVSHGLAYPFRESTLNTLDEDGDEIVSSLFLVL